MKHIKFYGYFIFNQYWYYSSHFNKFCPHLEHIELQKGVVHPFFVVPNILPHLGHLNKVIKKPVRNVKKKYIPLSVIIDINISIISDTNNKINFIYIGKHLFFIQIPL